MVQQQKASFYTKIIVRLRAMCKNLSSQGKLSGKEQAVWGYECNAHASLVHSGWERKER